ncbi:unnamed protein product [Porites lobata]|uniref:Uncharacterized protein n=1 Tax=Porites lobata TaxID=104759 RepID=A0ABN8RTV3_9CNID|nr:unnamed protein product [Porites lobata]
METRSRETTPTKDDLDFIVDDGYRHDVDPVYDPNDKYLVSGKVFKKLTQNAKKLGAESLDYSKRKNNKYMVTLPTFFEFINNLTSLSQKYLENEYGPDLASSLTSLLYYKQEEYTDKKGKKKTRNDPSSASVFYAKLVYSEKSKKILSLFKGKGGKDLNPFKYINQYCNVKLALIIEGIFISKTVTSLQIKVHECYVKQLKPREFLITIEEEDEDIEGEELTDEVVEDLILSDKEENE